MNIEKKILSKRFFFNEQKLNKNNKAKSILKILNSNTNYRQKIEFCSNCGSKNFDQFSETEKDSLPVNFLICINCGLISSHEYFSENFTIYYYENIYNKFRRNKTPEELFAIRTAKTSFSWTRYNFIKNNLKEKFNEISIVMEPGCNDGCNLYPFLKNGKEVYGCDFDKQSILQGKRAGIEIFKGGIEQLVQINKKADLIILSHLVAHVPYLDDLLKKVKDLLSPNGKIYIETPGFKWWKKQKWWHYINKNLLNFLRFECVYIFELKTLLYFMNKNGFKLLYGNEKIHSLFSVDNSLPDSSKFYNHVKYGNEVYQYLKKIEKDYLSFLNTIIVFASNLKKKLKEYVIIRRNIK